MKSPKAVLYSLFIIFIATGCSESSLEAFADSVLYPISVANKTKVPENATHDFNSTKLTVGISLISTWYYENSNPNAPVVIYFHGNGLNIGSVQEGQMLEKMKAFQTHIVIFDYPLYGLSLGIMNQNSFVDAGEAVYQFAKEKFPSSKVYLWGQSLGAAVAIQIAKKHNSELAGLVLTQPWDKLYNMVKFHYSSLLSKIPEAWFQLNEYNSLNFAPNVTVKTLMHHGEKDSLIPNSMGLALSQAFPSGVAEFHIVPGKDHNDILQDPNLWVEIDHFVK